MSFFFFKFKSIENELNFSNLVDECIECSAKSFDANSPTQNKIIVPSLS